MHACHLLSLPPISQRNPTTQQGGYWLAEKTDGVRYVLFVLGGGNDGAIPPYYIINISTYIMCASRQVVDFFCCVFGLGLPPLSSPLLLLLFFSIHLLIHPSTHPFYSNFVAGASGSFLMDRSLAVASFPGADGKQKEAAAACPFRVSLYAYMCHATQPPLPPPKRKQHNHTHPTKPTTNITQTQPNTHPNTGLAQALPAGTILDGELVYNRLSRSYVFLVFDVLFWGAEPLMQVGGGGGMGYHTHVSKQQGGV